MNIVEEVKINVDKQGRVCDKQGRPLRDRASRTFGTAAFMGKEGKPHPRSRRLQARQEAWAALRKQDGRKRPGSVKK